MSCLQLSEDLLVDVYSRNIIFVISRTVSILYQMGGITNKSIGTEEKCMNGIICVQIGGGMV